MTLAPGATQPISSLPTAIQMKLAGLSVPEFVMVLIAKGIFTVEELNNL
jgi:hypothetical protein